MSSAPPRGAFEGGPPAARIPPFGPTFFLTHLAAFVRQRCPDPAEGLPLVHLHVASGEVLDLCHVIALTPCWIALAVYEEGAGATSRHMRTELVPYELLMKVTIRVGQAQGARIGFHQESAPLLQASPEEALQIAAIPRDEAARSVRLAGGRTVDDHGEVPSGAGEAPRSRTPRRRARAGTR